MYYPRDEKPSPTLTSYNSILHSSPEYVMNETVCYAVTHSQTSQTSSNKGKDPGQSSQAPHLPIAPIATRKTQLYLLLPVNKKKITQRRAGRTVLMMTVNYTAKIKQSKKAKGKQAAIQGPMTPQRELCYSPANLSYLSERAAPLRIEDPLLDTPPRASPAFGPLYNDPDDNQAESSQVQLILDSLNARLHGICGDRIR